MNHPATRSGTGPFAIIGGGLVGLCCALSVQACGYQVMLIDPGDQRRSASFGCSGQLALGECVPLARPGVAWKVPGWLLDPMGPLAIRMKDLPHFAVWLARFLMSARQGRMLEVSEAMAAFNDRMLEDYEPLIAAAGAEALIGRTDALRLFASREEWVAERESWALRERHGLNFALLDARELRVLEPDISENYRFSALIRRRYFIADPGRFMDRLSALFVARGGTRLAARVTGLIGRGDGLIALRTDDGDEVPVTGAVLAAGVWSGELARQGGDWLPLRAERGYHVMLPMPKARIHRAITLPSHGMSAVPMVEGLRLSGTVELARAEAPPTKAQSERLLAAGRRLLPGLDSEGATSWVGSRPSLPDGLPAIGRARGYGNLIHAFGHGHMGLSWAATTGLAVAALVQGQSPPLDLQPFSPRRFQ